MRPRSGRRAPTGHRYCGLASPSLPDPRSAGPLGLRSGARPRRGRAVSSAGRCDPVAGDVRLTGHRYCGLASPSLPDPRSAGSLWLRSGARPRRGRAVSSAGRCDPVAGDERPTDHRYCGLASPSLPDPRSAGSLWLRSGARPRRGRAISSAGRCDLVAGGGCPTHHRYCGLASPSLPDPRSAGPLGLRSGAQLRHYLEDIVKLADTVMRCHVLERFRALIGVDKNGFDSEQGGAVNVAEHIVADTNHFRWR